MVAHFPLMIPGAGNSSKTMEVVAPFDRQVIATVDTADSQAVEQALTTAYGLYRNRDQWLPAPERIAVLERAAEIMQQRFDELVLEAAREGGKPINDSKVEVARAIDGMKICIETIRTEGGEVIPMGVNAASLGRVAFTRSEPVGVIVAVSAFNHPLNLIVHQVAPAIATGCPVIVKPSEDTPLSCFRFVEILREAGLPDGWCQALSTSDHDVATQLVTDERVGFFTFIGSAKVGWMLRSKLAPGTRCALEHGGAAPVIVAEDADLDDGIPLMAKGGFYHAGQVCVSVQRVYVHQSLAEEVAQQLVAEAQKMTVGDPLLAETDIGPLIRPAEVDRIHEWVTEAVAAGAQLLCGGEKLSDTCYAPTVLLDPPEDVRVSSAEIFGPVICVYSYADMDDALQRANSLPFSFQASVFTRDIDSALKACSRLDAAAVMVNDHTAFRVDWMPFAGLKQSGLGVGGIPHTMHDMQIRKMVVIRSSELS
jgi:acyl-CoA reductase-like NAD-dependent aldehyde dehydrogenase